MKKYYTLDEANAALPQVKHYAAKILRLEEVRQEKQKAFSELMYSIAQNGGNFSSDYASKLTRSLERTTRQIQRAVDELQRKLRCEVKGLHPLLVDFYSMREDREVYLCWKHDEDEITHWHDLDTGFAGRRPI